LGGPRSVAATYDGRDRARPSLMQIKSFNCRSNNLDRSRRARANLEYLDKRTQ